LVAETLGLSRANSHRRLTGAYQMPMDEVALVARRFGETLDQVLEPALTHCFEKALLQVSQVRIPCEVKLGPPAEAPFSCEFVALGGPGNWVIVPSSGVTMHARAVQRLLIRCSEQAMECGDSPAGK
jgi:hypothetical protein